MKVYKLKEKFCYLIKQNSEKKTALRELSSCVIEKFNRCKIIHVEFSKNLRQPFHPIDILYRPVKKCDVVDVFLAKSLTYSLECHIVKDTKSNTALPGNIISARITMLKKINSIAMLKIAQVAQATFIILVRKVF